jgi:hypothetical protein
MRLIGRSKEKKTVERLLENTRRKKAQTDYAKKSPEDLKNNICITPYSCTEKKRDVSDMRRGAGEKI